MGTRYLTDEFKRGAVAQMTEGSYPIKADLVCLGVSLHALRASRGKFETTAIDKPWIFTKSLAATSKTGILDWTRTEIEPVMALLRFIFR